MSILHSIWRQVVSLVNGTRREAHGEAVVGLAAGDPGLGGSSDPDFSEEFGYERGFAGGSGFENVEFDRWV